MISFRRTAGSARVGGQAAPVLAPASAPLRLILTIPPSTRMVGEARRWFKAGLAGWDRDVAADAESLFSELATNAVKHGRGQVTITVRLTPQAIRCEVHDRGWRMPCRAFRPDLDREAGRGIGIVTALAHAWGVRRCLRGKTVWFEILASGRNASVQ